MQTIYIYSPIFQNLVYLEVQLILLLGFYTKWYSDVSNQHVNYVQLVPSNTKIISMLQDVTMISPALSEVVQVWFMQSRLIEFE